MLIFLLIHINAFLAIHYYIISGSSDLISSLPRWIHCLIDFFFNCVIIVYYYIVSSCNKRIYIYILLSGLEILKATRNKKET